MTGSEFAEVAVQRLKDAEALLAAGLWSGAYYLAGYSVECALKAIICKQFAEHDLPRKGSVDKIYTHNLEELVRLSKIQLDVYSAQHSSNWDAVRTWNENSRYEININEARARELLLAIGEPNEGVLAWLKTHW